MTTIRSIDWQNVARTTWTIAQLVAMAAVFVAEVAYEHRQQIKQAAVKAVAAAVVTAEAVFHAGKATGNWVGRISSATVNKLPELPEQLAPVAPIIAPVLAIAESASVALSDWLELGSECNKEVEEVAEVAEEGFGEMLVRTMDELVALPADTLREMANTRGRYSKAKLAAMVMVS